MSTAPHNASPGTSSSAGSRERGHRWFAAAYDRMSASEERGFMGAMRRELLAGIHDDVLEIGAGTGANFAHYPDAARVTAFEPDPYMRARAEAKLAALARTNIVLQAAPAEHLPVGDASFDAVVSTLVLCTVSDVPRALAEVARVLRPGGELRFIEHVRGTGITGGVQDIIKPVWKQVGAGCNVNRRTEDALRAAGFAVTIAGRRKMMGWLPLIAGTATRAQGQARHDRPVTADERFGVRPENLTPGPFPKGKG